MALPVSQRKEDTTADAQAVDSPMRQGSHTRQYGYVAEDSKTTAGRTAHDHGKAAMRAEEPIDISSPSAAHFAVGVKPVPAEDMMELETHGEADRREHISLIERASMPRLVAQAVSLAIPSVQTPAAPTQDPLAPAHAPLPPAPAPTSISPPGPPAKWSVGDYATLHAFHRRGQSPLEAAVRLPKFTLQEVQAKWYEKFTRNEQRLKGKALLHAHEMKVWDQPDPERMGSKEEGEEPRETLRQNIMGNLKKRTRGL